MPVCRQLLGEATGSDHLGSSAKGSVVLVTYGLGASVHRQQSYCVDADLEVPLIEGLGLLHKVPEIEIFGL